MRIRGSLAALGMTLLCTIAAADTLPFIHDDYAKAIVQATKENKPVFVEAWAPW